MFEFLLGANSVLPEGHRLSDKPDCFTFHRPLLSVLPEVLVATAPRYCTSIALVPQTQFLLLPELSLKRSALASRAVPSPARSSCPLVPKSSVFLFHWFTSNGFLRTIASEANPLSLNTRASVYVCIHIDGH